MGSEGEGLVRKMIREGGVGGSWVEGKARFDELSHFVVFGRYSGCPLSTPEDVQVFVGDCHSLASQHVFSSAAAGFLPRGGRLGQLTA